MIAYDCMCEAWDDDNDPDFKVTMTPEGTEDYTEFHFENQKEFWDWYNKN